MFLLVVWCLTIYFIEINRSRAECSANNLISLIELLNHIIGIPLKYTQMNRVICNLNVIYNRVIYKCLQKYFVNYTNINVRKFQTNRVIFNLNVIQSRVI